MEVTEGMTPGRGRASLTRKVDALARRERLFPADSKALVMVSGGQDSLTLLHILASGALGNAGPTALHAMHVNYHLRGAESDADEALVSEVCTRLGVELTVVEHPLEKSAGNVQEAARDARRAAAEDIARRHGCERIALGHTADDQAETMLYRMGRYGGLGAFAGMRPSDPPWVRPLLNCRREETAAYCLAHDLEFARDRGNEHPGYARTGIRESVLPAWEAALPGAVPAACRAAEVAAEMKDLAEMVVAGAVAEVLVEDASAGHAHGALSARALLALAVPVRRLLLHHWLGAHATEAASRASVLAVESLLEVTGSAKRSLGGGWRAIKEYDLVRLDHGREVVREVPTPVSLSVPGTAKWGGVTVSAEPVAGFRAVDTHTEAIIDADAVTDVLEVRGPVAGDRVHPLGAQGSRKVKDLLVDLKVPARQRPHRPLVVCGEHMVWVCGLVVADEVKVTRGTKRYLRLSIEWGDDGGNGCGR